MSYSIFVQTFRNFLFMTTLFFTYMVLCADDSFYVGITNAVAKRVMEHNSNDFPKSYTYTRRPVQLVFVRPFFDSNDAISFEKQLQKWSRKKKWALALGDLELVHKLAECRNASHYKNLGINTKVKPVNSPSPNCSEDPLIRPPKLAKPKTGRVPTKHEYVER